MSLIRLLARWCLHALALLIVAYIVPGFHVDSFSAALLAVLVIGFLNMTLGLLLKIITLPLSIFTLGLFSLVINAFILEFSTNFLQGFRVTSFGAALLGAVVLALVHIVLSIIAN